MLVSEFVTDKKISCTHSLNVKQNHEGVKERRYFYKQLNHIHAEKWFKIQKGLTEILINGQTTYML
jgi:hypothetical protein